MPDERSSHRWRYGEIRELRHAVRLRPEANLAGDRGFERVVEQMLTVEKSVELRAVDADLDLVPGPELERDVLAAPLDEASLPVVERPENEVVLRAIEPHGEIIAVRLEIEHDAGAAIEGAADHLKADRDLAVLEVLDVLGDGDREVRECFDIVDEFLVTRAVDSAGVVSESTGRLPLFPGTAVDEHDFTPLLRRDDPAPDHRQKPRGLGVHLFAREVDANRRLRERAGERRDE